VYLNKFLRHIESEFPDPNTKQRMALYKSLVTLLVDDFDLLLLQSPDSAKSRGLLDYLTGGAHRPINKITVQPADPRKTIIALALGEFARGILDSKLPVPTVEKLFSRLTDQSKLIEAAEFHPLWLPFVRQLVIVLNNRSIPLTTPRYQRFCAAVLQAYVTNYVVKEPEGTISCAQPPVNCLCRACDQLNDFLQSPIENVGHFTLGKQWRQHLQQILRYGRVDCTYTTDRWTSPKTLVVTKTFTNQSGEGGLRKVRAEEAKKQFDLFDQAQLRTILGRDYDVITGLHALRAAVSQQGPSNDQQHPQSRAAQACNERAIIPERGPGLGDMIRGQAYPWARSVS
jgi:hypothetical protein